MGAPCSRAIFLILNVLFLIAGVGAIVLGIIGAVASFALPKPFAYALIAFGGLILFLSLLGSCGTCRRSQCATTLYFIFVLLFLLAELALVVLLFVFRSQVPVLAKDLWTVLYNDASAGIPILISLEQSLLCCGFSTTTEMVPPGYTCTYTNPCATFINDQISSHMLIFALVLCGLIVLFIFAMILACYVRAEAADYNEFEEERREGHSLKKLFDAPPKNASVYYNYRAGDAAQSEQTTGYQRYQRS